MTAILDTNLNGTAPRWLPVAASVGVLWYAFGLLQFWLAFTLNPAMATANGTMSEAHAAAVAATPGAIWAAFALASFLGLAGSVLLFLRSGKATLVFGISLACAVVYYAWIYGFSGTGWDRPTEETVIGFVVLLVTFGFFSLSSRSV